jgi:hypothetical protein
MTRINILIYAQDQWEGITSVQVVMKRNGLAVSRGILERKRQWVITHLETSLIVASRSPVYVAAFRTKADAINCLRCLARLGNWKQWWNMGTLPKLDAKDRYWGIKLVPLGVWKRTRRHLARMSKDGLLIRSPTRIGSQLRQDMWSREARRP